MNSPITPQNIAPGVTYLRNSPAITFNMSPGSNFSGAICLVQSQSALL